MVMKYSTDPVVHTASLVLCEGAFKGATWGKFCLYNPCQFLMAATLPRMPQASHFPNYNTRNIP